MTKKKSTDLAQKIKIFMLENGISQRDLAKKMKIAPQTVSQFLGGKYNLRTDTVEKIAKALGAPGNYFFDTSTQVNGNSNVVGKNISVSSEVKKDIALLMAKMAAVESKIENLELKYNLLKKGK